MQPRSNKARLGAGSLVLSAAALAAIAGFEGYRARAYVPVPGDVVTIGHGTTVHPDGTRVQLGDTTTPERAMQSLRHDATKFEAAVLRCAPVPMHQHEFDAYVSITYNIGEGAFCGSSMARRLKSGDYAGACKALLAWDKFRGQPLRGLTVRRQSEYKQCMGDVT
ncbi:MAG: glycoside hydrolase family protein [Simplicispira sp.]|nr:glycoside hydrolase family protein [Simplicispira sp.]